MKVLIYSHSFLPQVGGVELYTDRLARHLVPLGVDPTVATRSRASEGYDADRQYPVVRAPAGAELEALIARSDVLHCNGFHPGAFRAARRHHIPLLWFHHDYDVICPKSIAWNGTASCHFSPWACVACLSRDHPPGAVVRRIASYALKRACLRWPRVHAVHTEYARERMGLRGAALLRCAADLRSTPSSPALPPRGGEGPGEEGAPPPLLFAGRLIPEKGCGVLLEALALCREAGVEVSADVCGDGPERGPLERRAAELGLQRSVRFRGTVPQETLADLMGGALATVVPSVWDEVTGAVALEAMGWGCPVIASEVGGLGEMVGGVGLLFERGSARGLAARVAAIAGDPSLGAELSRRSYQVAHTVYNWHVVAREYPRVYQEMVEGR